MRWYSFVLIGVASLLIDSCSPSITEALRPTSTARKVWNAAVDQMGISIVASPDGLTIVAFPSRSYEAAGPTLNESVLEASNGERKNLSIPDSVWSIAFSPDGARCAVRRAGRIQTIQLSTGVVLNTLNDVSLSDEVLGMAWESNDKAIICAPDARPNNCFEMSATSGGPSVAKFLSALAEVTDSGEELLVRILSPSLVQCSASFVVDTDANQSSRAPEAYLYTSNVWPEGNGDSWIVLDGPRVRLLDKAGNLVWDLPLAIDERGDNRVHVATTYSNPRTSKSGRYLSLFIQSVNDPTTNVLIVDLNTGAQLVKISVGTQDFSDKVDVVFDPTDERNIYISNNGNVTKWKIE